MPFTPAGFLALKIRVLRYMRAASPDQRVSIEWPDAPTPRDEPDFTFTLKLDDRAIDITLSAADVENGYDWQAVLDDRLNNITRS
jgi:hypothetical protein